MRQVRYTVANKAWTAIGYPRELEGHDYAGLIFNILFNIAIKMHAYFCYNSGKSMVTFDSRKRHTSHVIFHFVQLIIKI